MSRSGHFALERNILEARIETKDSDCASFLLDMGKYVAFPQQVNDHICEDCQCLGSLPLLRNASGEEECSDVIIPFRDSYVGRAIRAREKNNKPSGGF